MLEPSIHAPILIYIKSLLPLIDGLSDSLILLRVRFRVDGHTRRWVTYA